MRDGVVAELAAAAGRKDFGAVEGLLRTRRAEAVADIVGADRALGRHVRELLDLRCTLWDYAFEDRSSDRAALEDILASAQAARNLEWQTRAADRLATLIARDRNASAAHRWCLIGESRFLAQDLPACHRAVERAERLAPEAARASALRMALALQDGDFAAASATADRTAAKLRQDKPNATANLVSRSAKLWRKPAPRDPSLEVVVFAHVTDKHKELGAPSVGLVAGAVESLRERANLGRDTRITVFFDSKDTDLDREYRANLENYCAENGMGLRVNSHFGLRRQWQDAFETVTSDLVAIVEQDYLFNRRMPDMAHVKQLFANRRDINYLRLNRRSNVARSGDRLLFASPADNQAHICRSLLFSNAPHVQRTEYFRQVIGPIIARTPAPDGKAGGAAGVEEAINKAISRAEGAIGLPALVSMLGYGIWGDIGYPAVATHTGV
jgi:hypothetical protein